MYAALLMGFYAGTTPLTHDETHPFERHAAKVIRGEYGPQPQWKISMLYDALRRDLPVRSCRISYYHPREAGNAWRRWTATRMGTMVRPGVASCTLRNWNRWRGMWLWIEGYGVCHVEDCFPESTDPYWFDLASPATPSTRTYSSWLASSERARYAREFGLRRARFVVLNGPRAR